MAQSRVAERYAKALLDLANEQNELNSIFADVKLFQSALSQSRQLELLLNNPVVKTAKKTSVFSKLFQSKMNPITFGFLKLVLQKRRESNFAEIASSFMDQYNAQKGITNLKLITAVPVSDEVLQEIIEKIKSVKNFDSIQLEKEVDPSIIGGFIAEFNNKIMDQSVQTNLNQIKRRFSAN